jgi:hypothetical protein
MSSHMVWACVRSLLRPDAAAAATITITMAHTRPPGLPCSLTAQSTLTDPVPPPCPPKDTVLQDGARQKPSYNLRTLSRALDYARSAAPLYGLQRALYDGFAVSFLTQLAPESGPRLESALCRHLLPGVKSVKVGQVARSCTGASAGAACHQLVTRCSHCGLSCLGQTAVLPCIVRCSTS